MAPRQIKMPGKDNSDKEAEEVFSQRKRPGSGRYLLQVDKQTKGSYKTPRRLRHGAHIALSSGAREWRKLRYSTA